MDKKMTEEEWKAQWDAMLAEIGQVFEAGRMAEWLTAE